MKKIIVGILLALFLTVSCTTVDADGNTRATKTSIGAGVGAAAGAVLGQIIGRDTQGTLIGAGIGTAAGAVIGNIFDRQEEQLKESLDGTGVEVQRTGEGEITLIAPDNITFATNSATINSKFYSVLNDIATVINQYKDTDVIIEGHTDNTGNDSINIPLSENRANAVGTYLRTRGVDRNRISTYGYGSSNPIATNSTVSGRAANRRVEIKIIAREQ